MHVTDLWVCSRAIRGKNGVVVINTAIYERSVNIGQFGQQCDKDISLHVFLTTKVMHVFELVHPSTIQLVHHNSTFTKNIVNDLFSWVGGHVT